MELSEHKQESSFTHLAQSRFSTKKIGQSNLIVEWIIRYGRWGNSMECNWWINWAFTVITLLWYFFSPNFIRIMLMLGFVHDALKWNEKCFETRNSITRKVERWWMNWVEKNENKMTAKWKIKMLWISYSSYPAYFSSPFAPARDLISERMLNTASVSCHEYSYVHFSMWDGLVAFTPFQHM